MVVNNWIAANLIWITLAITIVVLIYFVFTIIQATRKKRRFVSQLNIILLILGLMFLIFLTYHANEIEGKDWGQIILMLGLVIVTALYASSTEKQADASVKMADGMARPVIDFKRDTAEADIDRRTLEAYAAIHEETSHGLSCILCNVGVGSAIDVRSFIEHPERGRLPFEFGTIESRGKTERWILSIRHEGNRIALVACYEDIYGRTLKSSREVSIDKENHDWKLDRLKVVPVQEDELP